jgi:hypothetical protein
MAAHKQIRNPSLVVLIGKIIYVNVPNKISLKL